MIQAAHQDREWPFYVRGYYGPNCEPPKVPNALAFETKHKDEASKNIEMEAAHSRDDIGRVEWGFRFRP